MNKQWEQIRKSKAGQAMRQAIYERDGYECVYCQKPINGYGTLDHVLPKSKNDNHTPDNLVTCCVKCNSVKGDKSLIEFIEYTGLKYDTLTRVNRQLKTPIA